jgi:hypothetical protein
MKNSFSVGGVELALCRPIRCATKKGAPYSMRPCKSRFSRSLKTGVSVRDPALRGSGEYLQDPAGTTIEALPCFLSFQPPAEKTDTR